MKTNVLYVILVVLFTSYHPFLLSQGEWNNWYFGNHAGLNFGAGMPAPLINSQMWPTGRCPAIESDSTGALLFYTNGNILLNRMHNATPNGNNLFGGLNGAQPVIAFKKINADSLYYLFTVGDNGWYNGGLCYSIIDMRLNGGLGDIPSGMKNIPVPGASEANNALTATRHKNNKDVWVLTSIWNNGYKYLSYLVNSTGVSTTPIVSNSFLNFNQGNLSWGYLNYIKISPDGTKLICLGDTGVSSGKAEFCSFDCNSGAVTPLFKFHVIHKNDTLPVLRFEFSPNSKFLYITADYNPDSIALFQFDATKSQYSQFMASKVYIGNVLHPEGYGILQSGPDGKIYEATINDTLLNLIKFPNLNGTACSFQTKAISLKNRYSNDALYNTPQISDHGLS